MTEYQLFPDIRLVCGDKPVPAGEDELMICCCVSGICEYHSGNAYSYLNGETVLAFSRGAEVETSCSKDFRGLFIMIAAGPDNADITDLFGITRVVRDIVQNERLVYQADGRIHDLLTAILAGADKGLMSLIRLKTIELFMLLGENKSERKSSKKAVQTGTFICKDLSEHYTISQLSEMFRVNQTTLKSEFRRTYGCGIYSYIKRRKMFRAAELLMQTNMKIIDIAEEVGYSNASKFANAFSSVMGITPKRFRMEHICLPAAENSRKTAAMRY